VDGLASLIVHPHAVRLAERDSLADAADRTGLRIGDDCWGRLRDWQEDGIWDPMHFALLSWLARDGDIDWSRTIVDSLPLARLCLDLL
jgi:hypothetical protein